MAEPTGPGQSEKIDGILYISAPLGNGWYWEQPATVGLTPVWRRSEDGTNTPHWPLVPDDPRSLGTAVGEALSACVNGDTIEIPKGQRYELSSGGAFSLQGRRDVTIKGGLCCRRNGTDTYLKMWEFDNCENIRLEEMVFDGEAGISAPTDTPPTHQITNPNQNGSSFAYMVHVLSVNGMKIVDCEFRQHAAPMATSSGYPQYQGADAIRVDAVSHDCQIQRCNFSVIGYAGVANYGQNCQVMECLFEDVQWHGVVNRNNTPGNDASLDIIDCTFRRKDFTSLGYQGAVDCNHLQQVSRVNIVDTTFDFPYDNPTPYQNGGMFMVKVQRLDYLHIKGCTMRHGNNGTDVQRDSVRAEAQQVGTIHIESSYLSGSINGIKGYSEDDPEIDHLIVDSSTIGKDCVPICPLFILAHKVDVTASDIYYNAKAIDGSSTDSRIRDRMTIRGNRFHPTDSRDSFVVKGTYCLNRPEQISYDSDNMVVVGAEARHYGLDPAQGDATTYVHRVSDTDFGRLCCSTGIDPATKIHRPDLHPNFGHGTASSISQQIRRMEPVAAVPYVLTVAEIDPTKSNYQKLSLSGDTGLDLASPLDEFFEGARYKLWVEDNGFNLTVPSGWDPENLYQQPTASPFLLEFEFIDNGLGTIVPLYRPSGAGGGGGGIPEAPNDGLAYVRQSLDWATGVLEAPIDTQEYVRKDGAWHVNTGGASGVSTWNGRTGDVVPEAGDYIASAIVVTPNGGIGLTSSDVQAALEELQVEINTNTGNISINTAAISTNATNIGLNTTDIDTNKGDIATNTAAIATIQGYEVNSGEGLQGGGLISISPEIELDIPSLLNASSVSDTDQFVLWNGIQHRRANASAVNTNITKGVLLPAQNNRTINLSNFDLDFTNCRAVTYSVTGNFDVVANNLTIEDSGGGRSSIGLKEAGGGGDMVLIASPASVVSTFTVELWDSIPSEESLVLMTDTGKLRNQEPRDYDLMFQRYEFQGGADEPYKKGDQVTENGYLGVAKRDTWDHLEPQVISDPYNLVPGDPETWPVQSMSTAQMITGNVFTFTTAREIGPVTVYYPSAGEYQVRLQVITDPARPITTLLPRFVAAEGGSREVETRRIVGPGEVIEIALIKHAAGAAPQFSGNWDYQTGNNNATPASGQIIHRNNFEFLVHKTDNDSGSRAAELETLEQGDTIEGAGITWTVEASTDGGAWMLLTLIPTARGTTGVQQFTFTQPTPETLDYYEEIDTWTAPTVGFSAIGFRDDADGERVESNNGYGVQLGAVDLILSDDWHIQSTPGGGGGGGGGGGTAGVTTWNGRSGAVVPTAGDYAAAQVTVTPVGNLTSPDVQSALLELQGDIDSMFRVVATKAARPDPATLLNGALVKVSLTDVEYRVEAGVYVVVSAGSSGDSARQAAIGDSGDAEDGMIYFNTETGGTFEWDNDDWSEVANW